MVDGSAGSASWTHGLWARIGGLCFTGLSWVVWVTTGFGSLGCGLGCVAHGSRVGLVCGPGLGYGFLS